MKTHPIEVEDEALVAAVDDVLPLVHILQHQSGLAMRAPRASQARLDAESYINDLAGRIAARARIDDIQPNFLIQAAERRIARDRVASMGIAA